MQNLILHLAYCQTLRTLLLDYARSLKCEIGLLLHDSLFHLLHFVYLDLVRCGTRDHLKSLGFGLSSELSQFSAEINLCLGWFSNTKHILY